MFHLMPKSYAATRSGRLECDVGSRARSERTSATFLADVGRPDKRRLARDVAHEVGPFHRGNRAGHLHEFACVDVPGGDHAAHDPEDRSSRVSSRVSMSAIATTLFAIR